ncbi:MAG: VCBS repeat-containing protein [Lentisphaeria bacterium]
MKNIFIVICLFSSLFAAGECIESPFMVYGFAAGDLNGDGKSDIVICGGKAGAALFYQQSSGGFGKAPDRTFPKAYFSAAIFDLDWDGKNDLLLSAWQHYIYFFYAKDDFSTANAYYHWGNSSMPLRVCSNPNGTIDIFCGSGIRRLSQQGKIQKGFVMPDNGEKRSMEPPCICDVNKDWMNDYVFRTPTHIWVYYGPLPDPSGLNGHITPTKLISVFKGLVPDISGGIATFDANGDSNMDLLAGKDQTGKTFVLYQDRFDGFKKSQWQQCYPFGYRYLTADFDGDGIEELAVTDSKCCRFIRPGQKKAYCTVPHNAGKCYQVVAIDINGDGGSELAVVGLKKICIIKSKK